MNKQKEITYENYYVVLDNGTVVHITFREDLIEDIWESLRNAVINRSLFNEECWDGLKMELNGEPFTYLNCSKVVGIR